MPSALRKHINKLLIYVLSGDFHAYWYKDFYMITMIMTMMVIMMMAMPLSCAGDDDNDILY